MLASTADRPFVETSVARTLRARLKLTHEERGISVISGPWGIGKSQALNAFAAENEGCCAIVEVEPGSSKKGATQIAVMQRVVETLRPLRGRTTRASLSNAHWTLRQMVYESLLDLFPPIGVGGTFTVDPHAMFTLIFDEAQFLSREAIEMLRFWNDGSRSATPFPVGLVFVGNNEFALQEDASGNSVLSGAVRSRAMFVESMEYANVTDDDLSMFFRSRGMVDREAIKVILSYYNRPRAARDFRGAERFASAFKREASGGSITADIVRDCLGI